MKKFLSASLSLVLILLSVFVLASCGKDDSDKITPTSVPDGYQLFDNGDITFAYPQDWSKTDGSVVLLINENASGNNITVAYEAKSDLYKNMTVDTFNTQLLPSIEAMGMTVSNPAVSQTKNENGLPITKITYNVSYSGVSMKQTLFISAAGDRNYVITVTETVDDAELVQTVFDTLSKK